MISVSDELITNVVQAKTEAEPFAHFYLSTAFSAHTYESLLRHLPASELFQELRHKDALQPDGRSTRLKFDLNNDRQLRQLAPASRRVWEEVRQILMSAELQAAIFEKLKGDLNSRFRCPLSEVRVEPRPILLRDFPGYRIGVHSDIESKVVTSQFYLAADDSQSHLGTRLHRRIEGGFDEVKQFRFARNSGYAFAVTPSNCRHCSTKSWHSVARLSSEDGIRNSLSLTYYLAKSPKAN